MTIKRIRKYLFPIPWPIKPLPRRLISDYDIERATPAQLHIMQAGYARSPEDAQILLDKHGVKSADDLIPLVKKRRKTAFWRRLHIVLSRVEGAEPKGLGTRQKRIDEGVPTHFKTKNNHRI